MRNIESKVDRGLLAIIVHGDGQSAEREELSAPTQALQASVKRLRPDTAFRAHVHLPLERATVGTQEAWVVISGLVDVQIFDLDDRLLEEHTLGRGDCLITFRGGHGMRVLAPTLLYEFKNGPYLGQEKDKRFLP